MRFRTRLDLWGAALLSSLGALPIGCGGSVSSGPDETGGGPHTGGQTSNTGGSSGAGTTATGGSRPSGGGPSAGTGGANTASGGRPPGDGGATHTGGKASAGAGGVIVTTGGGPSAGSGGAITPMGGGPSAGSGGAITGNGGSHPFPCTNPKPLLSVPTGYEQCADGHIHRTAVLECPSTLPRTTTHTANPNDTCAIDADCTARPHGYCSAVSFGAQIPTYSCQYGCRTDGDCSAGLICLCGPTIGTCVKAGCTTDADCNPGFECASYEPTPIDVLCTPPASPFACQTPADTCGGRSDCPKPAAGWAGCDFNGTSRVCSSIASCAVAGRPFLVRGDERLAPLAARSDWLDSELEPNLAGLDSELRDSLAERWTRLARMEHASIAAFARFALQLVSLGAPAELVEQATQALADETRHARACFAVASRYAGRPIGPGPLPIEGSLDANSLEEILILTVREGCIGETVAAIETWEASEHAEDPVIRDLLRRISADETRHAELAWRFVAWALGTLGPEAPARVRIAAELERGRGPVTAAREGELDRESIRWLAHGIVHENLSAALRSAVSEKIVRPCARALGLVTERRQPSAVREAHEH